MVPGYTVGIYGCYCSWNCAKRCLLDVSNRPWFALLAITALKTGARLPIKVFPARVCPPKKFKEIVRVLPDDLKQVRFVNSLTAPFKVEAQELTEPTEVYEANTHISLVMPLSSGDVYNPFNKVN
jgi:hypothetical protein